MKKKIPYGTKIPVKLTVRERSVIRDETFCDPDFAKLAIVEDKGIQVELSLDEIEEIQGHVAATANHAKNKKLEKELDLLFDKLQTYLDKFEEQDAP